MANRKPQNNGVSGKPEQQPRDISLITGVDPPVKRKWNKHASACALLASMTSTLLGYVMSGAGLYIQKDLKLSDVQLEVIMGILSLYSLLGSAAAGRTSDWIGRRYTIVLASVIFFAGALFMGFATNYGFLMVGRFVAGIGVGHALMIAPVYTAEVSPAATRGFLTSFPEVFNNAGAIPSVFLALGVLAMPESPRWLVLQGRLGEAKKVLNKTSNSKEEALLRLADIKEAAGIPEECNDDVVAVPKRSHGEGVWKELLVHPTPTVRHILLCGVGIHFFQQISGIDSVVLYSPKIFEKAGINSDNEKLLATVAVGFTKTVFILVATFLLDRVGRRPLLLSSVGGTIVSLGTLGVCLTIVDHSQKKLMWAISLAIASVLSIVATFSIGMGPITWVYSAEIFPLRLRAQGTSMGVAMNRVVSGVVSMTFLSLQKGITIGGAFFLYMGASIVGFVFFYTLYPETQGRTLEEMQQLFGTFFRWWATARELEKNKAVNSNGNVEMGSANGTTNG